VAKLQLSFISGRNERVNPLIDGHVPVEGVELIPTVSDPSETFWRQLRFGEFDISEMSISSFLIAKERGSDMVAIPVFPSRRFMHMELWVHVDSGIETPADLRGKRVGVPEYQQTASLWLRGTLAHDFGVPDTDIIWYMERTETFSHGGATGFTPPPGITLHRVPPEETLDTMLVRHALDAAVSYRHSKHMRNVVDRATYRPAPSLDWSKIRPLFHDRIAEGLRFFRQHGFIPANHLYVIRGDVYRAHPWVAFNLYKAFWAAKDLAQEQIPRLIPSALIFGAEYWQQTQTWFGPDPYPYGIAANRPMLDAAIRYALEQRLITRPPEYRELFAESTLDL
jgi:4,5-dihydroxyphthalate decarboxylase